MQSTESEAPSATTIEAETERYTDAHYHKLLRVELWKAVTGRRRLTILLFHFNWNHLRGEN